MKLACYDAGSGPRCGVVVSNRVFDVTQLLGTASTVRDVQALLELGPDSLARVQALVTPDADWISLSEVQLLSPVLRPPTIRDFSVYEGHASMGGTWKLDDSWYRLPTFYFSNPLCVVGPDAHVPYPSATRKFDYELELAAVIGREGRNVRSADALDYIAGFTVFIDWSSRDLQRDEMQLHLGPAKGKDSANSLGPFVVTRDELAPLWRQGQLHAAATLSVNGVEWVAGTTAGMQHDWAALIERVSRDSRIVAGDVIGAGTIAGGSIPEAIRLGRPARYLEPGDCIDVSIEGIGAFATTLTPPELDRNGYRFLPPTT
jgi:2-keto-4-pentenoate hydratase/2-oxohepta-3-ene-1,7-dioic acid hydratase in catechol pathway